MKTIGLMWGCKVDPALTKVSVESYAEYLSTMGLSSIRLPRYAGHDGSILGFWVVMAHGAEDYEADSFSTHPLNEMHRHYTESQTRAVDRWSDFDDWLADGGVHNGFGVPQLWVAETEVA